MKRLFLAIRSCLFYATYALLTLIFGGLLLLLQPFLSTHNRIRFLSYWGLFVIVALRLLCGVRYQINGQENIPKHKPFVVLSNHQSQWETYCLAYLFNPISCVLKQELFKIPVFGWCLSKMKPIAIDRTDPRGALKAIQQQGLSRIQDDNLPVLIFPEGTRQPSGEVGKFARSGAQLAIHAQVPVVFLAHNAGTCWVPGQLIKYPGEITLSISEPIETSNITSSDLSKKAQKWVAEQLAQSVDQLDLEQQLS